MCSFASVWGMIAALMAAVGGAVSSAFFGFAWMNAGPLAYLSAIGFFAASVWAALGVALLRSVVTALGGYCTCVRSASCASQCSVLNGVLSAMGAALSATVLLGGIMAIFPDRVLGIALLAAVLTLSALSITILVLAANLAGCQRG